jgi:hypothetical protein
MASFDPAYPADSTRNRGLSSTADVAPKISTFVVTASCQEFEVKGDRSVVGNDRILIIYKGSREVALFNDWMCVRAKEVD